MSFHVVLAVVLFAAFWVIPAFCLAASARRRGLPALTFLGIGVALGPVLSVALISKPVPAAESDRIMAAKAPRKAPPAPPAHVPYASTVSEQILGTQSASAIGKLVADSDPVSPISPGTPLHRS